MNRRQFLATTLASTLSSLPAQENRPRRLVLRSSWQTVNIGDIGHTPGVLHLLEQHLPDVEVRLWPSDIKNGVEEMLAKRFPKVKIVKGVEDVRAALAECDFLLHGSGPSLVAEKDVAKWAKTGKPYGIYGITFAATSPESIELISNAQFAYFRDSHSLNFAQEHGCKCPIMEFGPDGAFAVDLKNDAPAEAFLKEHGLEDGKFLCCIARFRNTPYWKIKKVAFDEKKNERNEAMKAHDSAPLVEAIIAITRQTEMKVLLCPEDASQMAINKEVLYDNLPKDVKAKVVWRETYWLTDEALSTYRHSAGLFGHEMHSPIMCIGNGIPAIVCRWAEQTSKGYMWQDIGLGEWLFDLDDEEQLKRVAPAVLAMAKDPAAAKLKAAQGLAVVKKRQAETMAQLKKSLG
ncbi:MAG: Polysaccharide pyruvyl transferase [Verrucomicrobiaceae bacterium]|nr:Polysaccharide pyruvyl transferase [Verrucomicrobiaceae bacterium]